MSQRSSSKNRAIYSYGYRGEEGRLAVTPDGVLVYDGVEEVLGIEYDHTHSDKYIDFYVRQHGYTTMFRWLTQRIMAT